MQNKKKKLISSLLALIMLLGLIAAVQTTAGAADIQAGTPTFRLGTTIGFGGKQWAVIGHNGAGVASPSGTLTLLLANGHSYGKSQFHADSNQYSGSDLKTAMDNAYNGISNAKEKDLVKARDLAGGSANQGAPGYNPDNIAGPAVSGARFWPLSVAEADKVNEEVRKYTGLPLWWLRSPGFHSINAAFVYGVGGVNVIGNDVIWSGGVVRPAFNLNLSSVIFTSAAAGGKSGNASVNLSAAAAPPATDAVKFTMIDSRLKLVCTDAAARTVKAGDTVNIVYSGATAGESNYVSCVIVDGTNKVLYYGKLAKTTAGMTGGIVNFTVPPLANGNYTVKLFSEEANGDNYTDFCSDPINIPMTVSATTADTTPPSITSQPVNCSVTAGGIATFSVTATGASPLSYVWYRTDGTRGYDTNGGIYTNNNTATLTLTNVPESYNGYRYYCSVYNSDGGVDSSVATLTVTPSAFIADVPAINGPTSMSLTQGYVATSSEAFTITGVPAPTVTKTSGDAKITWNNATKKLDIAAGLMAGTYTVILKAVNRKTPDAMFTFTLTVKENDENDRIGKPFPFTDVPGNAWYYGDVKTAWETRLIDGVTDTLFKPRDNLTYAQAVKLAACMHQLYKTGSVTLANGSPAWYQSYVDYAKANSIISKDYDWGGSAYATRAGYMEIFANALPPEALAEKNMINDGTIPDVPMSHPQAAAIYKLYRAGILEGVDSAHNCNPGANITRDEVSAILTRMMNPDKRKGFSI